MSEGTLTHEQIEFTARVRQLETILREALESRGRLQNRVKELEGKLSALTDQIEERDMALAAMSEPPVWRDGPPPEPGLWWTQHASGVRYLRDWNQQMVDTWPKAEHRHAPAPEWLKPPVDPRPEPKPDLMPDACEAFMKAAFGSNGLIEVTTDGISRRFRPESIRHLWPHIEAAIKKVEGK